MLTHRAILKAIWGPNAVEQPEHLWTLVAQLRKKIEPDSGQPAVPPQRALGRLPVLDRRAGHSRDAEQPSSSSRQSSVFQRASVHQPRSFSWLAGPVRQFSGLSQELLGPSSGRHLYRWKQELAA